MGYADPNCPLCNGSGIVRADGGPGYCTCFIKNKMKEYMGPIMGFKKGRVDKEGLPELRDINQAIVVSDNNIACLIFFASRNWYARDKRYNLIGAEELNTIGMRGTSEYKSLSDYVGAFQNFVIDMSSVNPMRGPGYREKDEMVLLDFLRMLATRADKRSIVLIGPTAGEFKKEHQALCRALATMRFPYFDSGRYLAFAKS